MNNPKLRFKEFASDWKIDNLSDLSSIIDGDRGKNYPKEKDFFDDEFCLFLNAGNVTKLGFDLKNKLFITKEKDQSLRNGKLERNDIVLTTRGTVGNVVLYNNDIPFDNVRINSGMVIVRNKNKIIPEYLYSYMKSPMFESQVNKTNFGSAQPQLTIKGLAKFKVSYPEEKEQIKVSNFLSLLDKKIELQSKKIEDLKLFKKGLTKELFRDINNNYFKIKDLDITISDGNYGELYPKQEELKDYGDVPFLRVNNLRRLKITNENMKYISKDKHSILLSGHLKENDILITTRGEIGLLAIVDKEHEDSNINAQIALLRINDYSKILPNYLLQYLDYNSNYIQSLQTGSALKQLPIKNLLSMNVYIPDIKMQEKISNTLTSLDNKIEKEYKKMDILYNLKKGLMQNMFV